MGLCPLLPMTDLEELFRRSALPCVRRLMEDVDPIVGRFFSQEIEYAIRDAGTIPPELQQGVEEVMRDIEQRTGRSWNRTPDPAKLRDQAGDLCQGLISLCLINHWGLTLFAHFQHGPLDVVLLDDALLPPSCSCHEAFDEACKNRLPRRSAEKSREVLRELRRAAGPRVLSEAAETYLTEIFSISIRLLH